jgi:hypothetical protein
MQKPRLLYDTECPVCSNFVRLIKRKISETDLEYYPSGKNATDFQYVNKNGIVYTGIIAIDKLSADFSQILDYMWMLPPAYKTKGLAVAYKVGSVVRTAVGKIKKSCNCGKH